MSADALTPACTTTPATPAAPALPAPPAPVAEMRTTGEGHEAREGRAAHEAREAREAQEAPGGASLTRRCAALRRTARKAADSIEARTPAHRDRAIDGLRAVALLTVPLGHWMVGGFTRDSGGVLHNASPLATLDYFAPLSWVLQLLGIFFLVGGFSSVLSHRRAIARGEPSGSWLRGRLVRLGRPVLGVTAVWATLLPLLSLAGVPGTTLRTAAVLVVQPLWFVGIYAGVTALTPYCSRASERLGAWAAAPLLVTVAVVDVLRYGPWADSMPSWLGLVNLLPGWLFAYQVGVCWGEGRLGRRGGALLLTGGAALFATLLLVFHYPASMVGVPGEIRTNSHPPSLLVPALASFQCGAALLLRDRIARALRRPALWAPVVVVNLSAMTIFCWHQSAMLASAVPSAFLGTVSGLTTAPDSLGWILARLAWLPVFALALVAIGSVTRRFDGPWKGAGRVRRTAAGALAAAFALYAFAVV